MADEAMPAGEWVRSRMARLSFWCALAIVVSPLLIFQSVFSVFIDDLTPAGADLALAPPRFLWQAPEAASAPAEAGATLRLMLVSEDAAATDPLTIKIGAAEAPPAAEAPKGRDALLSVQLGAAYRFGLASAGLTLAAIAALLAAGVGVLLVMPGRVFWLGLAVALALLGAYVGYTQQWSNPLRQVVADCPDFDPASAMTCPLNRAAASAATGNVFSQTTLENAQFLVSWSAVVGMIASGVLVACFAALAFPIGNGVEAPLELRRRRQGFFLILGLAAVLMSFAVATTHAFYGWSATLVQPPAAEQLQAIASMAASYWGFVFTVVLLVAAGLSAAALGDEIRRAAEARPELTPPQTRKEWLTQQELAFDPARSLAALMLSVGPLVTSPLLDALKSVIPT